MQLDGESGYLTSAVVGVENMQVPHIGMSSPLCNADAPTVDERIFRQIHPHNPISMMAVGLNGV